MDLKNDPSSISDESSPIELFKTFNFKDMKLGSIGIEGEIHNIIVFRARNDMEYIALGRKQIFVLEIQNGKLIKHQINSKTTIKNMLFMPKPNRLYFCQEHTLRNLNPLDSKEKPIEERDVAVANLFSHTTSQTDSFILFEDECVCFVSKDSGKKVCIYNVMKKKYEWEKSDCYNIRSLRYFKNRKNESSLIIGGMAGALLVTKSENKRFTVTKIFDNYDFPSQRLKRYVYSSNVLFDHDNRSILLVGDLYGELRGYEFNSDEFPIDVKKDKGVFTFDVPKYDGEKVRADGICHILLLRNYVLFSTIKSGKIYNYNIQSKKIHSFSINGEDETFKPVNRIVALRWNDRKKKKYLVSSCQNKISIWRSKLYNNDDGYVEKDFSERVDFLVEKLENDDDDDGIIPKESKFYVSLNNGMKFVVYKINLL